MFESPPSLQIDPPSPGQEHDGYVLGTHGEELARLRRQHAIWRDDCARVWRQAGFTSGSRLLDLGCGPGFAALDLAELVGSEGEVLGLDSSARFLAHLQASAEARGVPQLRAQPLDLGCREAVAAFATDVPVAGDRHGSRGFCGRWDGAWCRWLAMFLPSLDPLLDLVQRALRPGGRLVLHEYLRWDTFSLHPEGAALERFVHCCIEHWRSHGGDPHVASRLPALLEPRGFRLEHCRSLMACAQHHEPKARWLQDFLASYPGQLQAAGVWSAQEQQALQAELDQARRRASVWVTPALVEMVWVKT